MKETTTFSLFVTLVFMQWLSVSVQSANISEANVIGASEMMENPVMTVVEDSNSESGWAVKTKKAISKWETQEMFLLFLVRKDPKAEFYQTAMGGICHLLSEKVANNFLPKQIAGMIFPKWKGKCGFEAGEQAIIATGQVNTNLNDSRGYFREETPYELEVQVVDNYVKNLVGRAKQVDFFKVTFNIGEDMQEQ